MIVIISVIIIITSVVLSFFILIQNPEGGGLSGTFGSIGSQVMGVKRSTDAMEKGTWTSIGIIAALCIFSVIFVSKPAKNSNTGAQRQSTSQSTPVKQAPAPQSK